MNTTRSTTSTPAKTPALIDVSWEICNKVTDLYSSLVVQANEAVRDLGDSYIAIGPDTGKAGSPDSDFEDDVWSTEIFEALSMLPFACRMGRWKNAANARCILIQSSRLLGNKDEILARYGQLTGAGTGHAADVQAVVFAHAAGQVAERLFARLYKPQGVRASVRCQDWPMVATALFLRERAPELGIVLATTATTPSKTGAVSLADVQVSPSFPKALKPLEDLLKKNLWWSWHSEAINLVADLDPELWLVSRHDPVVFFRNLSREKLEAAAASKAYTERLASVVKMFEGYMAAKKAPEIAYFCMEYGLSAALRFYSGGLGILAGDHLKATSDLGIPLCAFGLAYREGYFKQVITAEGKQEAAYEYTEFDKVYSISPVVDQSGKRIHFTLQFPFSTIHVQAWKVSVGRVDLYLLDTDLPENKPQDRRISDRLYGGDNEHRMIQEFVLSIGGFKLIELLGLKPKVFHMNEGHCSFLNLERLAVLVNKDGLSIEDAIEYLRHSTIFTTHTPVPAGHDRFGESMIRPYLKTFADRIGMEPAKLLSLSFDPDRPESTSYSTTAFCVRTSERVNGVSAIHGDVSRRMFQDYFPGYGEKELPVTSITNGVHPGTWLAPDWQDLFSEKLGSDWRGRLSDRSYWQGVLNFDPRLVWDTHLRLKGELIRWLKQYLQQSWEGRSSDLAKALAILDCNPFIATYARRFATYKRPSLILKDLERLRRILNSGAPVVFLYSGKAHPMDRPGKDVIKEVNDISRMPEFAGKIIFIENYDMDKAAKLVRGSDIWVNNPTRPLEASGTSGMKAGMNGCLNLSVPDGWWAESYNGRNGWAIGEPSLDQPAKFQEIFDSTQIYLRLEQEVLPTFFQKNAAGVPEAWVSMMKESMATIIPDFSTDRMLLEYRDRFYSPAIADATRLSENRYASLRDIGTVRERVKQHWNGIEVAAIRTKPAALHELSADQKLELEVEIQHPNLQAQDLVVQAVVADRSVPKQKAVPRPVLLKAATDSKGKSVWSAAVAWEKPGTMNVGVRVSPRNPVASNPEPDYNLNLVRWL